MNRVGYLAAVESALMCGEVGFARDAAETWLADWPGDLAAQFALARALSTPGVALPSAATPNSSRGGDPDAAVAKLSDLLRRDPEWLEAWRWLARIETMQKGAPRDETQTSIVILDPSVRPTRSAPGWAVRAREGRQAFGLANLTAARDLFARALKEKPPTLLPYLLRFRVAWAANDLHLAAELAESTLAHWPRSVALQFGLADCLMRSDPERNAARAAQLLQSAAAADTAGQVAERFWPENNPYAGLWPEQMTGELPGPLPARVAALLGSNRLGSGPAREARTVGASVTGRPRPEHSPRYVPHIATKKSGSPKTKGGDQEETSEPVNLRGKTETGARSGASVNDRARGSEDAREVLKEVEAELQKVALRLRRKPRTRPPSVPHAEEVDARVPAYVVVASETNLRRKYGDDPAAGVLALAHSLAQTAGAPTGWRGYCVVVDSAECLAPFELNTVNPANAWDIKLLLRDLDAALEKRGEMIGAVALVGGHDLIPFHLLPNPTDDVDEDVPSDNPYATRDENYFIPEWPVGRLPAGSDSTPTTLVRQLRAAIANYAEGATSGNEMQSRSIGQLLRQVFVPDWLAALWPGQSGRPRTSPNGKASFGYSASIWKEASMAVFRAIDAQGTGRLLTSPPVDAGRLPEAGFGAARLSYFNLHGVEDGPEWFGQREPDGAVSLLPEYPVALRPSDVLRAAGRAPQIVFSEACYGANTAGKSVDEALCLKFLDCGSKIVVGSTKIAYGSVSEPLIGADLLGERFWQELTKGVPAGEALRRAKITLARQMHLRQGYLDGEDQKTLISFVCYGDPLARLPRPAKFRGRASLSWTAPGHVQGGLASLFGMKKAPAVSRSKNLPAHAPLACDRMAEGRDGEPLDADALEQVKSIVAKYLPGMQEADYVVTHPHAHCSAHDHDCPTAHLGHDPRGAAKSIGATAAVHEAERNVVITLSKVIHSNRQAHPRFARLTLDAQGKVLKLAVSR